MPKNKDKIPFVSKQPCPMQQILSILGGKWSFSIVYALMHGKKRFKVLERSIEGINTRMLVKELKLMEEHGLVTRKVFPEIPPRVEYSLTAKGKNLQPILNEFYKWGAKYAK